MNHELRKNYQITIDDVGYDAASNRLVLQAIESGIVQNLAVMTTMPGSDEVLDSLTKWQKRHPALQIGLHLNLTEGQSLSKPSEIPSLLRSDGTFWPWPAFLRRSAAGQINPDHIRLETNRQFEQLSKAVPAIDFFNSHHHIHLWPALAEILMPIVAQWPVWGIRQPRRFQRPQASLSHLLKALAIQWFGTHACYPLMPLTTHYLDLDWAGKDSEQRQRLFKQLTAGTELGCHPHAFLGGSSSLAWLLDKRTGLTQIRNLLGGGTK